MKAEIYGTERCSFCHSAIELCKSAGVKYEYIDVDNKENFQLLSERLGFKPRTVPQIYLDGQYLSNGFKDLQQKLFS